MKTTARTVSAAVPALLLLSRAASAAVVFDAPGHVADEGAEVRAEGGEPGAAWRLVDWRGRPVEGASGVFGDDGRAALPPLASGYYRMVGEGGGAGPEAASGATFATLAVVSRFEPRGSAAASAFAVDTALSWIARPGSFRCPWNGGDTFSTVADLIARCGFRHVRERLRWQDVQKEPGAPLALGRYLENADRFAARGMAVSGMFHDAPAWAGTSAPRESLPSDLAALHDFCRDAAAAFGDRMEAWEFWNEEDIHFAREPVWEYAAAMKAAYLGFKAGRPDLPVLCGALCQMPASSRYNVAFLANGAARYFDVFNYHTYIRLSKYPELFSVLRRQLRKGGAAGKPVWFTEFGTNSEGNSDGDGAKAGMKAHSPGQELVHAEFYPKGQIALGMAGVERAYFFVFPAFNERGGRKDWGVMRRDGTVKPVYSAMATAIRELDGALLLGALDAPAGVCARLFEFPGGSQTVAFWSESPLETADGIVGSEPDFAREWRLPLPEGQGGADRRFRLVDLCGSVSAAAPASDGSLPLPATRFPAYVSGLRGLVASVPPARPESGPGDAAAPADADFDPALVIRPSLDGADFALSGGKTLAVMKGDAGNLKLQVWNLSAEPKTVAVSASGAAVSGLPSEAFGIAPFGRAEFDCTVAAEEGSAPEREVVFSGTSGGREASRAVVPVFFEKRFLADCTRHPVAWRDPARWESNTLADEETISFDEAEGALRIDSTWRDRNDPWTYPVLALDLPAESLDGAVRVSFEAKSVQDKVENDFKTSKFMIVGGEGVPDVYLDWDPPTVDWETRYVDIPVGAGDGARAIRLGANPRGSRCTLWFRNLEILK